MDILTIISGLIILYLGGEALIKGSISVARHLNISRILVTSVIVGFGTSMPEMTVSVEAMLKGAPEIAIGNVIGSNIANILFILGISAIISPFCLKDKFIQRDVVVMLISTIILCILGSLGMIGIIQGLFMLVILASYITYSYLQDKNNFSNKDIKNIDSDLGFVKNFNLPLSILMSLIGVGLLIVGSSLFLDGSIEIANKFNISKEVIGLGIVAIGSCLPELTTVIVASIRKHGNIVIASIVGSNIFNILSIIGVISVIDDVVVPEHILKFDLWIFLTATIILSYMLLKGLKFSRKIGSVFLMTYILYFCTLFYY
ncbi:MAG: cation:H+ antiporter [Rickettsiales bacterium]